MSVAAWSNAGGGVWILFDEVVWVSYGQMYVTSDDGVDMTQAFAGQSNGLCGAAVPGALFLVTSTHTGRVRLTVERHAAEPPVAAAEWEEVVEAPFTPAGPDLCLVPWNGDESWPLDLGPALNEYRVRYCASGMARSREAHETDVDVLAPDRYLLQFWPLADGVARPDAVLRLTTPAAAYWHDYARSLPRPPSPQLRAEAERRAQAERERRREEQRRLDEARHWGGHPPSDELRRLGGTVSGLAYLDRDLVDGVVEADPDTQRRIAHWAARHAFTFAGIGDLDWMAPAWEALDRGEPLPEPFTDEIATWARIAGVDLLEEAPHTLTLSMAPAGGLDDILAEGMDPEFMAVSALTAAALPDPLRAALEALWCAASAYGRDTPTFLAAVRRGFPSIDPARP